MAKVKELVVDYWGMFKPQRPHLALSLIGGAKNFRMVGRKKEIFKAGLISAAKSTNALILTGGNNTGSMKLVGDAVRDGQFMIQDGNKMSRGMKLIGLCSWGYVKNNSTFLNADINTTNQCSYISNLEIKHHDNVPLNGDHTHFLLIDDGSRYRFFGKYTEFITRFEKMVRDPVEGLGVPIVTLLLEGGKDAIRIVKDRLKEGISCVVIEGSGRAADIIAYAYRNAMVNNTTGAYTLKEGHIEHLTEMVETAYCSTIKKEWFKKEQMKTIMNWTLECIKYSSIITIFDIRRETQLDKKILSALLKGNDMSLHHQLYLALIWNRVDIAEEKIFVQDSLKKAEGLEEIMIQALLMERIDFIELLVMNGFVMKSFLTVERLNYLYSYSTRKFKELHIQLKSFCGVVTKEIHLKHIHKLFVYLLKDHSHILYQIDHHHKKHDKHGNSHDYSQRVFDEPYIELFFWSILTGKGMLIDFFWHRLSQPLLTAIIAGAIYSNLSNFYKRSKNFNIKKLQTQKQLFQERANKLVEIAFKSDQSKGVSLLERRNKRWGNRNVMELGYIGHLRAFIANPSCQLVTQSSWKRGFVRLHGFSCIMGLFLPFLVWTPMVKFQPGLGDDGDDLKTLQKLYVFYKAPIIKYTGTCVSFMTFLALYSYVALFGFRYEYQVAEVVLYCWILVLILDELRELAIEPSKTLIGKLSDYVDSVWNKFDIFLSCMAILAFILRNFYETFFYSRVLLAFNCAFFYVRLFRIYHASRSLGPKLVIFHRMIPEIVTFMFLLIIFIMAYGVASQAIIDPYRQLKREDIFPLLYEIVFLPYWQMYGELSLDKITVRDSTGCNVANTSAVDFCMEPDMPFLSDYNYVTPIFLAIYLLIGNVMLLNLLIAIFTSVFEDVHENSNEVWKWEMYRLVEEYDQRPGLAPPLVVLEDLFKLLKGIWKVTCRRKKENLDTYMQETIDTLRLFEKDCMGSFVTHEKVKVEKSLEAKIDKLNEKTDKLMDMFDDVPDESANWGQDISTNNKLYKTALDHSSDSSSSDNEDTKKKKVRYLTARKRKSKEQEVEDKQLMDELPLSTNNRPETVRTKTARNLKSNYEIKEDLSKLEIHLQRMEQKRANDWEKIEKKIEDSQRKMEKMIANLLLLQRDKEKSITKK